MSTNSFPEGRTRSQINLSDDILTVSEHSPMKNARNEARKPSKSPSRHEVVNDSEDELLLSPEKRTKSSGSKRSVSPSPNDEYNAGSEEDIHGRELKRMKWDLEEGAMKNPVKDRLAKPGHTRTNSEPGAGPSRNGVRKRAGTALDSSKPNSTSNAKPTPPTEPLTEGAGHKARAQSVPLFSSSSSLPSLDLRNPPLSPIRARSPSRSPDKSHGLKVHPSPPKPTSSQQLSTAVKESRGSMEVGQEPPPPLVLDTDMDMSNVNEPTVPAVSVQPPASPAPPVPQTTTSVHLPMTPAPIIPSGLSLSATMSPLTPLPETPLPPRTDAGGEDRYISKNGWSIEPERENGIDSPLHPLPQPNFGQPKTTSSVPAIASHTQIPRPSIGLLAHPPLPVLIRPETGKAKQSNLRITALRGSNSSSGSGTNAFALLMKNASKQDTTKGEDKGKGKSVSLLPKVLAGAGTSNAKGKGKGKAEPEVKKVSLKDRMKRKEKKKPEAPSKFVPVIFDDDDDSSVEKEPEPGATTPSRPEIKKTAQPQSSAAPHDARVPLAMPIRQESLVAGPSRIQESILDGIKTGDVRLPTAPSPISSMTSLSDSEPENTGITVVAHTPTTPTPTIVEGDILSGADEASVPTATTVESASAPERQSTPTSIVAESPLVQDNQSAPIPLITRPLLSQESYPTPAPFIGNVASITEISEPRPLPTPDPMTEVRIAETLQPVVKAVSVPQSQEAIPSSESVQPKTIPKKRKQSNIPTSTRVTRSAFRPPAPPPPKPTRRPRANSAMSHKPSTTGRRTPSGGDAHQEPDNVLPQGSPMQTSSPIRTPSRDLRTPGSSPAKISLAKTPSKPNFSVEGSPSPTKIARAVSMFSRPADMFATDDIGVRLNGGSLSTLSSALEKLKMPAPSRPSTSLGFNPDARNDDDDDDIVTSEHPSETTNKVADIRRESSVKRSLTVGSASRASALASSSGQAGPSTGKRLVQKPMTMFFSKSGSSSTSGAPSSISRSAKSSLLGGVRPSSLNASIKGKGKGLLGSGGGLGGGSGWVFPTANKRLTQKASRKTTLPTVEASPVKGGATLGLDGDDSLAGNNYLVTDNEPAPEGLNEGTVTGGMSDVFMAPLDKDDNAEVTEGSNADKSAEKGKVKVKDRSKMKDSSRRASLAFSQLSQSLSAGPAIGTGIKGSMGPPATPRKVARSASSSYPAQSNISSIAPAEAATPSTRSGASPDKGPGSGGKRFSARQAAKVAVNAEMKSPSTSAGPSGSTKTAEKDKASVPKVEKLTALKDCRIFVDVRTDDGEAAGGLFIEMLENLGAKMQARVGQACTHVIFKNGLMSTISRYRLLRDPKPCVVGIAWVVDCVEQKRRVDEAPFLIDLSEMNITGTNKRRRSMLPKLISSNLIDDAATDVEPEDGGDADVSMDGSTSSVTLDDDLTPLERARRRRSMIFGPSV